MLNGHFARSASAGSNWGNMPANDSFNIRWRHITKKELSANMDSDSEICLIGIFTVGFMGDYGRGNQFSKVVHDESGKDLLVYVLHLFCVEMEQPNSIFQFPERSFDSPAHIIEFLQFFLGKSQWVKICKNGFIGVFGDFEPDNTKVQHEEDGGIVFTILFWQKIKNY